MARHKCGGAMVSNPDGVTPAQRGPMNLSTMLRERAAAGRPIRIGQIGAGKFGIMFLSQVRLTPGMHLAGLPGVLYSLAWGDQPALICEHVDWARACGFKVVAAGKGTRYHPSYHQSTPDKVWDILDQYLKIKDRSHINPKMFNSFLDGTKSGIEMTAVCNATGPVPHT